MSRKHYGFVNFAFDAILTLITGGLWLIWIFVREMRRNSLRINGRTSTEP